MASKAKLETPKKAYPEKGPSKSNPQPRKGKGKRKTPKKNPLRLSEASKNWWPVRGRWKGTNLRSQEGQATPGARLQPIPKRKKKKMKPSGAIGRWPRGWPRRQLVTGRGQVGSPRAQAI